MPVIIDYRIKLDGVFREGTMEFTGDLLPKPGESLALSIDNRNLDTVVAKVGELYPYRGRLHLAIRFQDFPINGFRKAFDRLTFALIGH